MEPLAVLEAVFSADFPRASTRGLSCLQGATVVDFAYHVHTDVGNQMFGAKVNGKVVHASHALANAEVVEVLTYDGRPSRGSIERHQVHWLPPSDFGQPSL